MGQLVSASASWVKVSRRRYVRIVEETTLRQVHKEAAS